MALPVGNEGFITEMDVRRILRDFPEANNLLDDYEFSPEEIRTSMTLAVDEWNDMPPSLINYTVDDFPFRSIYLRATLAYLMRTAAYAFARNNLSYTAGGGSVADQDKAPIYHKTADQLLGQALDQMRQKKNEINLDAAWGIC